MPVKAKAKARQMSTSVRAERPRNCLIIYLIIYLIIVIVIIQVFPMMTNNNNNNNNNNSNNNVNNNDNDNDNNAGHYVGEKDQEKKRDACSRIPMSGVPKGAKNCDSKFTLHLPSRALPEAEGHVCHAEKTEKNRKTRKNQKTEREKGRKAERAKAKRKGKERLGGIVSVGEADAPCTGP